MSGRLVRPYDLSRIEPHRDDGIAELRRRRGIAVAGPEIKESAPLIDCRRTPYRGARWTRTFSRRSKSFPEILPSAADSPATRVCRSAPRTQRSILEMCSSRICPALPPRSRRRRHTTDRLEHRRRRQRRGRMRIGVVPPEEVPGDRIHRVDVADEVAEINAADGRSHRRRSKGTRRFPCAPPPTRGTAIADNHCSAPARKRCRLGRPGKSRRRRAPAARPSESRPRHRTPISSASERCSRRSSRKSEHPRSAYWRDRIPSRKTAAVDRNRTPPQYPDNGAAAVWRRTTRERRRETPRPPIFLRRRAPEPGCAWRP